MKLLITLGILTLLVALYVTLIRPVLRQSEWAKPFFAHPWVEWLEINLWAKSEAILWARWQQFLGLVLTATGFLGGIDYTVLALLTPDWIDPYLPLIPFVLNITGTIAEALRRDTTKPLAVVALPEVKPPEVAAVVARVEAVNAAATVAVEVAKAEGKV